VEGGSETVPPDKLTQEQTLAVRHIRMEWAGRNRPVLISGVTGSGKTLVYMELIADVLAAGKQAIMLIPEIALTRQTVERFVRRFGKKVSFLHSRLSDGEKYDQMRAARSGDISIMVGPRSALFTPFAKLGLIVID
jgi:primosomal protein N' (replication factor Y)